MRHASLGEKPVAMAWSFQRQDRCCHYHLGAWPHNGWWLEGVRMMLGLSGKRVAASSFQQTVHSASLDYQPLEQPKPVNSIASAAPRRGNEDERKRWTDALTLVLKGSHCRSAGNQALFLTPWGTGAFGNSAKSLQETFHSVKHWGYWKKIHFVNFKEDCLPQK